VNLYGPRMGFTRSAMIEVRDAEAFQTSVLQSTEPTVVMFWATWCPFCRRFKADFERVYSSRPWRFAAVYLDDESNPLWEDYAVGVVPTLALFRDGQVVDRLDGVLGYGLDRSMVDAFFRRVQPALP
jgi:thioredoxin 1